MKTSIQLIAEERLRQIREEGYSAKHDELHVEDELAFAAACYASPNRRELRINPEHNPFPHLPVKTKKDPKGNEYSYVLVPDSFWPWDLNFWKPTPGNRVRELVKAAALIAAEIDRLQGTNPLEMEENSNLND